jgi:hypothetical protein
MIHYSRLLQRIRDEWLVVCGWRFLLRPVCHGTRKTLFCIIAVDMWAEGVVKMFPGIIRIRTRDFILHCAHGIVIRLSIVWLGRVSMWVAI